MPDSPSEQPHQPDASRDDVSSGAPGTHPLGTDIGAASAGATGAAIGAVLAGPVGAAVGAAAGAVFGAVAGKNLAEAIDPTAEDAHWRAQHAHQSFVEPGSHYEDYAPAYRVGYEGYVRHAAEGKDFTTAEPALADEYLTRRQATKLAWEKARHAARAAWHRAESASRGRDTPP